MSANQFAELSQFFKLLKSNNDKIALPNDLETLLRETDEFAMEESLDKPLSKNFKISFIVFNVILNNLYKKQISEIRKQSLLKAKNNGDSLKTKHISSIKLQRENVLTEDILRCKSFVAIASILIFCLNSCRDNVKRIMLLRALNGDFSSMKEAMKVIETIKTDKKNFNNNYAIEVDIESQRRIVQALMETSEFVKDKYYARLATTINEGLYFKAAKHYSDNNTFKTIHPYEPLAAKYLKDYVAQMYMHEEQIRVYNQYQVDPRRTIMFLLDKVSGNIDSNNTNNKSASTHRSSRKTRAVVKFDNNKVYEVFKGPMNYLNHLMITNYKYNNRQYRIVTYNDCLYDVIGFVSEPSIDDDSNTNETQLYNNIPWSKRLELLPYRAKIDLEEMTGEQLNEFRGYASVTVSWMENGLEYAKTFDIRNDAKIKNKIMNS